MDGPLEAAAWGALSQAWAWRWALIIGVGSFPALAVLAAKLVCGRVVTPPVLLKQFCALLAVLLCLHSLKLAADTYLVESQDPEALVKTLCAAESTEDVCTSALNTATLGDRSVPLEVWTLRYSGSQVLARPVSSPQVD